MGRADGRGAPEDDLGLVDPAFLRVAVDDPDAGRFLGFRIIDDAMDDRIGDDCQIARRLGRWERRAQARVIGTVGTAALADRTILATVAPERLVMGLRLAQIGDAAGDHLARRELRLHALLEFQLGIVEIECRKKLAVGKLREALLRTRHTNEFLYMIIPGGKVLVTDRPVRPMAVLCVGFEIHRREAVALPAPGQ